MASEHWQMSYPVLSTITYLSDEGSPTIVLPHARVSASDAPCGGGGYRFA